LELKYGTKHEYSLLPDGYTKQHRVCDFVGEEWKVIVGSKEMTEE
jgi:hypothetical protein